MSLTTRKLSDRHESDWCEWLGAVRAPGSGSHWANPMDGRQNRMLDDFAVAFDGKATLSKSVGVSVAMWEKARVQAGGERPMLALRFYADERLHVLYDLVTIDGDHYLELREEIARLRARVAELEA